MDKLKQLKKVAPEFNLIPKLDNTLFEALAGSILSQQLSVKAASTIHGRFKALFPQNRPDAEKLLKLSHDRLRSCGLSESKALSLKDLAQHVIDKKLPTDEEAQQLSNEKLIELLTDVRGIGPWTVQMVLMFRYRREDVWPIHDLGVQKGFRLMFPKLTFKNPEGLLKHGEKWKGKRSHIAWYAWRALETKAKHDKYVGLFPWKGLWLRLIEQNGKLIKLDLAWKKTEFKKKKISADFLGEVIERPERLRKYLKQFSKKLDLETMQLSGTDFQLSVWKEIAKIPHGKVATYADLALRVNKPKGFRAVANACGANPIPLLIPCHRVVGTNNLGGFAYGEKMKKHLLTLEEKIF